jgi:hypothetical protein
MSAPAVAGLQNFTMHNNASSTIERVYISTSRDRDWGPDRLNDNQTIRPGAAHDFNFNGFDDCVFDIKVVFVDGSKGERRDVDLCRVGTFYVND